MTIQVQLQISINGGSFASGAQENVPPSATVALKASTASITPGLTSIKYEIYDYPPGFACPAGWSVDASTGAYFFAPANVTTTPPTFTAPTSGAQNWGWFMFRLTGNNNPLAFNADGTPNTAFNPTGTDEQTCMNIPSPVLGAQGVARGLAFQADLLRGYVGPLMQSLRAMDNAASGASFTAGGDLTGSGISQTVAKIHGASVPTIGTTGQVLQVTGATTLAYAAVNLSLAASVTSVLPFGNGGTGLGAVGANGTVLTVVAGAPAWVAPSGSGFTAGGDLGGTSTVQSVLAVNGASVPSAGGLTTGNVLQVTGSSALGYGPLNVGGGAGFITGTLPTANQASQSMAGDVTGTTAASVVAKINGATVPAGGSLTVGNVLQVLSGGGLTYGPINLSNPASATGSVGIPQGGTGLSTIGTADQLLGVNHAGTALAYFTPAGDATLSAGVFTVGAIQGFSIATTAPTAGQTLTWNSGASKWTPTTPGGGTSVTGSGVWHSSGGTLAGAAYIGTAGQFLVTNAGATDTPWVSLAGDVSASTGTPGSITVTGLQGHAIASGAPTAGQFLIEAAGATSWGPVSLSQDVSASLTTVGAITVVGIRTVSIPALASGYLQYNGSAFAWSTPSNSSVTGSGLWHSAAGTLGAAAYIGTAGQFLLTNAGATDTPWTTLSADVTASTSTVGAITVVALRGNPIQNVAATAGQLLIENTGATGSAWTSFSGDVTLATATPGLATVVGIKGQTVPTLATGYLQWTGSAFAWSTPAGAFTAAGDLSGSSSTQTVIQLQGRPFASTAPTSGQVISWNGSTWLPSSPASGSSVTGSGFWQSTGGTLGGAASIGTAGQFAITVAGATNIGWASISGDATGSTTTPGALTVTKIQGNAVSASAATAGQVLIENAGATGSAWTSFSADVTLSTTTPGAATVVAIRGNAVSAVAATAGQVLIEAAGAAGSAWTSLSQDVTLSTTTVGQASVVGIRGNAVPALAAGFLQWTGSVFQWGTPSGSFVAGGDLSGTSSSQTVIRIQGNAVSATAATAGQVLVENAGATGSAWTTLSADVSASLTTPGALTVVALRGNPVSGTAATAGQHLIENAAATGSAWTSFSGDATSSTVTPGLITNTGLKGNAVPTLAAGYLQWTGSVFAWTTPAGAFTAGGDLSGTATSQNVIAIRGNAVNATAATAGQVLIENSGATGSVWSSFSGDVSLSTSVPGAATVLALHGNPVSATAPTAGQFLVENAGATSWAPVSISGDVSASTSTVGLLTVNAIKGVAVPTLAAGYLQYNGSTFVWGNVGATTLVFQPLGTAGGNVYTTWAALVTASIGLQGPLRIFFDTHLSTGAATIPSGTWTFSQPQVSFTGAATGSATGDPASTVTCASGCVLVGVTDYYGLVMVNGGSSPVISFGATTTIVTDQTIFQGSASAPFFTVTAGTLDIIAKDSVFGDTTHVVMTRSGSGVINGVLQQGAVLAGGSVGGTFTTSNVLWGIESGTINQSGVGVYYTCDNPAVIVFQPGGTNNTFKENVFFDWQQVVSAANSGVGPVKIFFDGQFSSNACTIPAGAWSFTRPQVVFEGAYTSVVSPIAVTVTCANGCTIAGVQRIRYMAMTTVSTSAVFTLADNGTIWFDGATVTASAAAPLIAYAGTVIASIGLTEYTSFGDGSHVVAHSSSTGLLSIGAIKASTTLNCITGSNITILVSDSSFFNTATGVSLSYANNQSANLGYNDALVSPALGAVTVQAAIDALKTLTAGGGGITQLTGDVLAGPGTGSKVATVVAISGTSPIAITPNTLQWIQGATGPTFTQAQQANGSAPANFAITPQSPGAGASTTTNGTPGSLVVNVAAPVSTGLEAGLTINRTGAGSTFIVSNAQGAYGATFWAGVGAGNPFGAQSINNAFMSVNANGGNGSVVLNGLGTNSAIALGFGGQVNHGFSQKGLLLFGGNFNAQPAATYGGGSGWLAFLNAPTLPTSAPTNVGAFMYSNANALEVFASGLQFHQLGTPALLQVGATTDTTPQNLVITPQAPFSGATTTAHKTPGSIVANIPLPVSGGNEGAFWVSRNGTAVAAIGPFPGIPADGAVWLSTTAPSITNYVLLSTTTGDTGISGTSSVNIVIGGQGGVSMARAISTGIQIFSGTPSFGGGTGVLGITDATVIPTSAPSGGSILYSHSGAIETYASAFQFHRLQASPLITQVAQSSDLQAQKLTIQSQAAFSGATGLHRSTALNVQTGGAASGGTESLYLGDSTGLNSILVQSLSVGIQFTSATTYQFGGGTMTQTGTGAIGIVNASVVPSAGGVTNGAQLYASGNILTLFGGNAGGVQLYSGDKTATVAVTASGVVLGSSSTGNIFLGNAAPSDGGQQVVGIGKASTIPTGFASSNTGVELYARSFGLGGTQTVLELNANGLTFNSAITGAFITQVATANSPGGTVSIVGQSGGAGGAINNGGSIIVKPGSGAGGGTDGVGYLQTADGTTGVVQVNTAGVAVQSGGTLVNPKYALSVVGVAGIVGLAADGSGSAYVQNFLSYKVDGTLNTQQGLRKKFFANATLTTSGVYMVTSVPLPTTGSSVTLTVLVQGRVTSPGSGTTLTGDNYVALWMGHFQNNSGVVSRVGNWTLIFVEAAASLSGAGSTVTNAISGTNVQPEFALFTSSGTLGTADASMWIDAKYN